MVYVWVDDKFDYCLILNVAMFDVWVFRNHGSLPKSMYLKTLINYTSTTKTSTHSFKSEFKSSSSHLFYKIPTNCVSHIVQSLIFY